MTDKNVEKLPFIEDLEYNLLSAFLQDRKFWVRFYPHITQFYFKNKHMGRMFKFAQVYFEKHREFPTETQMFNFAYKMSAEQEMNDAITRVYKAVGKLQQHEVDDLYAECDTFVRQQKIKHALLKGVDLLEEGKYNEIEDEMRSAVAWNSDVNLGTQLPDAKERYEAVDELYENIITWPWKRLQMMDEGMLRKQLYVVISSSSVGKSIFLDNCAFNTWFSLKKNVISISAELSELKKGQRMDAFGLKTEMKTLRNNKAKVIKFYEDNKRENRLFIKEFPTSAASVEHDIRNYLYNLELYAGLHKKDIDLIVIDYGDIIRPKKITGNAFHDQGSVFEAMRALGQEYDCPVLTASQTNRTVVQDQMSAEELTEATIAESFKKLSIADWMLALVNTPEERANGRVSFKKLKDREGEKNVIIPMAINYPQLRIFDIGTP